MERSEGLLKADEVAELLSVAPATIYSFAHKGIIPCIKLGHRSLRFRRESIEKFINQQEKVPYYKIA